jgi:hypothetical protein
MVMGYYQQILQLLPMLFNPQVPPQMQQMVMKIIAGADKMIEQVFQSHQRFDLEDVLIGVGGENGEQGIASMAPQGIGAAQGGALTNGGIQAQQIAGLLGGAGAGAGNGQFPPNTQ